MDREREREKDSDYGAEGGRGWFIWEQIWGNGATRLEGGWAPQLDSSTLLVLISY